MRALIATAGLLALAGTAGAATVHAHTLRRAPNGRIEALAQDGRALAWLVGGDHRCNTVHLLTPTGDALMPQPAADSMTCHWDLARGGTRLAVAARVSSVLWTLHEDGDTPIDYVMTAQANGPEQRVDRLAHASDGTGDWLGGVAGTGTTLAYSTVDVEYVDKLGCLSGESCRRHVAAGAIDTVANGSPTPLPGVGAALQLAAAAGRLAYVPAAKVAPDGTPIASPAEPIGIVSLSDGSAVGEAQPRGLPLAIALSQRVLAVLSRHGRGERISWYAAQTGKELGSVRVSRRAAPQLAAGNRLIVFRVGRALRGITLPGGRIRTLAKTTFSPVGLSLASGRLVWAENRGAHGRLRTLTVG